MNEKEKALLRVAKDACRWALDEDQRNRTDIPIWKLVFAINRYEPEFDPEEQ